MRHAALRGRAECETTADPRRGTGLAGALMGLAVMCAAGVSVGQPAPAAGWAWGLVILLVAYGLMPMRICSRSLYFFGQPTIILAGLIGGPLVGLLAGIAANLADGTGVWPRRVAYGGIEGLQGVAAGWVGIQLASGRISPVMAVAASCGLAVGISFCGRLAIHHARGSWHAARFIRNTGLETTELVVLAPVLVLALNARDEGWVVLTAAASVLVVTGLVWLGYTYHRRLLEGERLRALTDPLTGAPNRRAFEDRLTREHQRVVNGDRPAAVYMIDLDRFKQINDSYRHETGDDVLRGAYARLAAAIRPGDLAARWGGEEFAVIAPRVDTVDEAFSFAERLRLAVGSTPIRANAGELSVTISVGGTIMNGADSAKAVMDVADGAMYRAKHSRNASVVVPPRDHPPSGSTLALNPV